MEGDAFQKLLLSEIDSVHRLACHLSHSRSEADDLVQETFLRALKSAGTFTLAADHGIRPWLFRILHNVVHTRYAKIKRERTVLEDLHRQSPTDDGEKTAASSVDFSAPVNWDGVDERLKHAIAELPLAFREVFLLSAVEGLKYRQIAEVIESPVGTVMSRLSRARAMLSARLAGLAVERRIGPDNSTTTTTTTDVTKDRIAK